MTLLHVIYRIFGLLITSKSGHTTEELMYSCYFGVITAFLVSFGLAKRHLGQFETKIPFMVTVLSQKVRICVPFSRQLVFDSNRSWFSIYIRILELIITPKKRQGGQIQVSRLGHTKNRHKIAFLTYSGT